MDNIHLIIRSLFQEIPLSYVQKQDANEMIHLMRELSPSHSLDQLECLWGLTQEKWMKPQEDGIFDYFSDSYFNLLFRFSERVLEFPSGEPKCKYEYLLEWHELTKYLGEDIFVISALALRDEKNRAPERKSFPWGELIDCDDCNKELDALFRNKNIAELHAHLNGSSCSFSLNWISAMNQIKPTDEEKRSFPYSLNKRPNLEYYSIELERMLVKAAAIRLYLFFLSCSQAIADKYKDIVRKVVFSEGNEELDSNVEELDSWKNALSYGLSYKCKNRYQDTVIDFALPKDTDFSDMMDCLKGERLIMYNVFRLMLSLYKEDKNSEKGREIEEYFHIYLLIKSKFRQEYIQCNGKRGFSNFSEYQDRKDAFYQGCELYKWLNCLLSVGSYFYKKNEAHRYLETRISPKDTPKEMERCLKRIKEAVEDVNFGGKKVFPYKFILHFIKRKDAQLDKDDPAPLRNREAKIKTFKQATSIVKLLLCPHFEEKKDIVGIDAASSEIGCRPEVFAHAYRFLRAYSGKNGVPSLGFTYHVGEDFLDVVDGLRAVDEAIRFLGLKEGDRIGHGLVLGVNVQEYYKRLGKKVVMPQQVLLDNLVWLYYMIKKGRGQVDDVCSRLEKNYKELFSRIYKEEETPDIRQYYNSWLIRGNCSKDDLFYDLQWDSYAEDKSKTVQWILKKDVVAKNLWNKYNQCRSVREEGSKMTEYAVPDSMIHAIVSAQKKMLKKVKKLKLHIECNPTSNVLIGGFAGYADHPIVKFNNKYLKDPFSDMSVSINTDDKGIFSTSLEREYSVMAAALEKEGYCKSSVLSWIEYVMNMGWGHRFLK